MFRFIILFIVISAIHSSSAMRSRCGPGSFTKNGKCELCPPGTYQENRGATSCLDCPAGTYSSVRGAQGLDICRECPEGTFQSSTGATSKSQCKKCPRGQSSTQGSSSCLSCPAGSFLSNCQIEDEFDGPVAFRGLCLQCSFGTSGTSCSRVGLVNLKCLPCGLGDISENPNSLECTRCPSGTTVNRERTKCIGDGERRCPPGRERRSIDCDPCLDFLFNDGTFTEGCQFCPLGQIGESRRGSTKCVPCPKGTFRSEEFNSRCRRCPPGLNSTVTGARFCKPDNVPCPPGFFTSDSGACLQCSQRERFDSKKNQCVECPENSISDGGISTTCKRCGENQVPKRDFGGRVGFSCECKDGFGFVNKKRVCRRCPPGTESSQFTSKCENCTTNTFSSRPGMTRCEACPEGFSQPREGQSRCIRNPRPTPCPKGQVRRFISFPEGEACVEEATNCPPRHRRFIFANEFSEPLCEPVDESLCPEGTRLLVDFSTGLDFCGRCSVGEFFNPRTRECLQCAFNEISPGGFTTSCTKCPEGRSSVDGRCECVDARREVDGKCTGCPRGTFGISGEEGCFTCPAGTFSDGTDLGICSNCRSGTFTNTPGSGRCQRCPSGSVSFGVGETGCVRPLA